MRRLLQPHIVIVGTVALALLGWSTVSAASGARHHVVVRQASVQTEPTAENETPVPATGQPAEPGEAAENEAAEPAEDEDENDNENPAPPAAAPAPATSSRTFVLVGGTVTFTCTNNTISLASAVPASGFQVETETEDGGQEIEVKFESQTHKSEIKASCVGGQVQANEIREESS